jgi:hypothetical protein
VRRETDLNCDVKAGDEWLIVHHKTGIDMDVETGIHERLPLFGHKVHFCHRVVHDATNQVAHVPNVILAGTLFMRTLPAIPLWSVLNVPWAAPR